MVDIDKNVIAERIVTLAKASNRDIKGFSAEIDIPYSTMQKYTKKVSKPTAGLYIALYNYGVNLHWFISGEGAMFRGDSEDSGDHEAGSRDRRDLQICAWIKHYMQTHGEDEQVWLDVELARNFPEYKEWKKR